MYDLGLRIKEIRKRRGLSQRELARRINKSYSVVCGYESNAQQPPLDVAISIASVLHVSLDHLVGNADTCAYSFTSITKQQEEIIECLLREFSNPTASGKELSSEQVKIVQKIIMYFSSQENSL